jgi:hypothetical protein
MSKRKRKPSKNPQRDARKAGVEGHGPGPAYNDNHPTHQAQPRRKMDQEPKFNDLSGRRQVKQGPHEPMPDHEPYQPTDAKES